MQTHLWKLYEEYESRFRVVEDIANCSDLVRANGNTSRPIHRWFRFKEGFSADLLAYVLGVVGWKGSRLKLLDPFCGVGTSLISGMMLAEQGIVVESMGIEVNPFLHFVAKTKSSCPSLSPDLLMRKGKEVLEAQALGTSKTPSLTTLNRPEVLPPERLARLLQLRDALETVACSRTRNALKLGYARTIERVSGVRKDGRALRLLREVPDVSVDEVLMDHWLQIIDDTRWARKHLRDAPRPRVLRGSGITLDVLSGYPQFDLIVYSPPYLNNIDYTEVYKMELWMLGYVGSYEAFRKQRRKTLRSHPSCAFPARYEIIRDQRLSPFVDGLEVLFSAIPEDDDKRWRKRLILGYFDDIYRSLKAQRRYMENDGRIIIVIGNSLHGGKTGTFLIATDLLIARIASLMGFTVDEIRVARYLRRRRLESPFLRESIVFISG